MAWILSISYDANLLASRAMLLRSRGYEVVTAETAAEAVELCRPDFDLITLCHSIPEPDKRALVADLRNRGCAAPILSILPSMQRPIPEADFAVDPEPSHVLDTVARILERRAQGQ